MLWNKVLLANPITAVIAVVVGLTAAIVTLSKETSTAEQAQLDYNDAVTDANKQAAEEEAAIMRLVSAIQSNTTAESDRKAALYSQLASPTETLTLELRTLHVIE